MSKVKGKHIEFNDLGTSTTDVWSADKIISYVGSVSNPFDQDLNTTDDVKFDDLELTGNLKLPTTTSSVGQIKQNGKTIFHTYGNLNIFAGINSGNFTMNGGANIGFGISSLSSLTTGNNNVALGYGTLYENESGNYNVAIGSNAAINVGGSHNIAIGYEALIGNNISNYNIAIGTESIRDNLGSRNVSIGYKAGNQNYLGSGNIFLGYESGYYETGNNRLYISNSNTATPLIYGEFDNSLLKINGDLNITGKMNIPLRTITNSTDTGTAGEICYDANFIYICTATNTWKRVAIGTW